MKKETLKGILCGTLVGALLAGGIAAAVPSFRTEKIEVTYSGIKVYKDNILCELKDVNGNVIEPFIYNGTTYMPVRGTANLAGMQVTWEGETQSVRLWDTVSPDGNTYLMDVCPPYQTPTYGHYSEYSAKNYNSFSMGGEKYTNGFTYECYNTQQVLFNLNGKYQNVEMTVGFVGNDTGEYNLKVFVDDVLIKEMTVSSDNLPVRLLIPVTYGLQLKTVTKRSSNINPPTIGFGNITVS